MKIITLKRICMTDVGTYGVMIEEGVPAFPFCLSLEMPWKDNRHDVSCIPKGEYHCKRVVTPLHGEVFEIENVPNRTSILFHKGNWVDPDPFKSNSRGCILLGESFEDSLNPLANKVVTSVMSSGWAYTEFMKLRMHRQDEFHLIIKEV